MASDSSRTSDRRETAAIRREMDDLLARAYRPYAQPRDLSASLMRELIARRGYRRGELRLDRVDRVDLAPAPVRSARSPDAEGEHAGDAGDADDAGDAGDVREVALPMSYAGRHLGDIVLAGAHGTLDAAERELASAFARELARLLQRYDVRTYARRQFGADHFLVGVAPELRQVEDRLERIAALPGPLLIQGELGCELRTIAFAAHCAGRPQQPFVEIACRELYEPSVLRTRGEAIGSDAGRGTLFLSDVDELDAACQKGLLKLLDGAASHSFRVIASCTRNLKRLSEQGLFSRHLWLALDWIQLTLPPLRARRRDIPHLVEYYAAAGDGAGESTGAQAAAPTTAQAWSEDALAMLANYAWPGNLAELVSTIGRLTLVARGTIINGDDVCEWARDVWMEGVEQPLASEVGSSAIRAEVDDRGDHGDHGDSAGRGDAALRELARGLLSGRADALARLHRLHPGLHRALTLLVTRFREDVSLEQLARHSFVSASHLGTLFKRGVGAGFVRMRTVLRVEHAKDLLVQQPHQRVTVIALQTGFGDISHFLKTFHRLEGVSPREYRRRRLASPE